MSLSPVKRVHENTVAVRPPPPTQVPLAALIGNPNTGKTSVFNRLTGGRHRVGNYPGVTVERRAGPVRGGSIAIDVLDLPGTYSLAARSPDEALVSDILLGRRHDVDPVAVIVVIVDACNLARNMLLVTQLLELNKPLVIALNMIDVARQRGLRIDLKQLRKVVGVPVVPISARTGAGCRRLIKTIERCVDADAPAPVIRWPDALEDAVNTLRRTIPPLGDGPSWPRSEVRRLVMDVGGQVEKQLASNGHLAATLTRYRQSLAAAGIDLPDIDARLRYEWIERHIAPCIVAPGRTSGRTRGADRVLTHRVAGTLIMAAIMTTVFCAVFSWAQPLMDAIDAVFAGLSHGVHVWLGTGVLASFLADGVIAGVGSVLTFLPQILILAALITLLEDSGYLARAALLADRLFRPAGLSGHSLMPLLSCFACAVPGILGARTVANPRERLVTILIAPLMSCSARIPVYVIMVAAFVPRRLLLGFLPLQGLVFTAMYVVGAAVALAVAFVLKKTILRGDEGTFLLELPDYRRPSLRNLVSRLWDQGRTFLLSAGTIILASSVVVWALSYFPRPARVEQQVRQQMASAGVTDERAVSSAVDGAYLRQSVLGRIGRAIEPAVKPLGWDWRIGVATLASFPAREVFIANLGVIYNLGSDTDEGSSVLRDALRDARWPDGHAVFGVPVALSVMVFFALCCQCQATLAAIKRETNSWRWPLITFAYMTVLAYIAAAGVYQIGIRFG